MKITLFPILRAFMLIVACSIFGQLFCYSTTLCVYDDQLSAVELLNSFRGTVKEEYVKRSELPHFLKTKRAQLSHVTHLKLLNSSKNKKKEKSLLTKEEFESLYFDYIPSLNTISLVCASLPKGINWEKIYETRYKNFLEIYIDEAYKLSQKELLNTLSTFPPNVMLNIEYAEKKRLFRRRCADYQVELIEKIWNDKEDISELKMPHPPILIINAAKKENWNTLPPQPALKILEFKDNTSITLDDLSNLEDKTPNLQILALTKCTQLPINPGQELRLPKTLKKIYLNNIIFTHNNLIALFKAAPQIEELNIINCPNFNESDILNIIDQLPPSLKHLKINQTTFTPSWEKVKRRFQNAAKLINKTPSYFESFLSSDTYFELKKTHITLENLNNLSEIVPNIKILDLDDCYNLHKPAPPLKKLPKSLKEIWLDNSSITLANLYNLLHAAPQIEALRISNCDKIDWSDLELLQKLPELRYLQELTGAGNLAQEFPIAANILFSKAPNLSCSSIEKNPNIKLGYFDLATNTLTLDHNNGNILCDMESKQRSLIETLSLHNITNFKKIADTATSQCTKISIKSCNLLEKYWDNLFEFAPNCKALSLYATPLPEKLPAQLTHLSIASDTTLEKGRLNNILEATTELTHLEIINCRQRDKASLELTVILPHLETLNLSALSTSQPFFSQQELTALFDKTPNLKTLIIKGHKDLCAIPLSNLAQLQQIDISFSPISLNKLETWATQLEQAGKDEIQLQIDAAPNLPACLHKTHPSITSLKQDIAHYKAQQIYIPLQERIKGLAYRSLFNKKTLIGAGIGSVVLYNYYKSKTNIPLDGTRQLSQLIVQPKSVFMPKKIITA